MTLFDCIVLIEMIKKKKYVSKILLSKNEEYIGWNISLKTTKMNPIILSYPNNEWQKKFMVS